MPRIDNPTFRTAAALAAAGIDPMKVPLQEDAITSQGILIWTGNIFGDELEIELWRWPDESWAEVAANLISLSSEELTNYRTEFQTLHGRPPVL